MLAKKPTNNDLKELKIKAKKLQQSVEIKNRKYNLTTYNNCFIGSDAVKVIIKLKFAFGEASAIEFGNLLIKNKIVIHVTNNHKFKNEGLYYKFIMDLADIPIYNDDFYDKLAAAIEKDNDQKFNDAYNSLPPVSDLANPPQLFRRGSTFDFRKPADFNTSTHLPYVKTVQIGMELLHNAQFNKGLAFTFQERREFNLHGLLPPSFRTLDTQSKQIMNNINRMNDNLDKYMFFMNILDTNSKLFYRTLCENLAILMPIVYTPTVGLACQKFGDIFIRPRGMYITIKDKGRIYQILKNWPTNDIRAICFTDGERILGLGDLGAQGMGIPIGKLALYTGCAGVRPHQLLPVCIDVGTNRKELRESEFYIGLKIKRCRTQAYDELIEEFMKATSYRWGPTTLLQFEDFGNRNAFRLLEKFQDKFCTFNDDIQGTAAVALAGIYSSLRVQDCPINKLNQHIFIMYGAGSAGVGIANLITNAICKETINTLPADARKRIWLVDSKGLIFKNRASGNINKLKEPYAHDWNGGEIKDLAKIIVAVKGTCLIGVSGQGNKFAEAACKAVLANNNRPVIFPMSNPTDKAECNAANAYKWTNNKCIFASGSPFPKMKIKLDDNDNKNEIEITPAQGNNAYIFPGVALGIIASKSTRIPNDMFLLAANTLSDMVTDDMLLKGTIYPPIKDIRKVSFKIAVKIAAEAYRLGLATEIEPIDLEELIKRVQYDHLTNNSYCDPVFNNLEQQFMNNK